MKQMHEKTERGKGVDGSKYVTEKMMMGDAEEGTPMSSREKKQCEHKRWAKEGRQRRKGRTDVWKWVRLHG